MKKRAGPDIAGAIDRMQQQLVSLERKMDALIRSAQPADQPPRYIERKQENRFRERILHKAICADCNKECEVPFRPSPDRPVYCKECFSKRKNGGPVNAKPDNKPEREDIARVNRGADKHRGGEAQKPAAKKRSSPRQRKKRA